MAMRGDMALRNTIKLNLLSLLKRIPYSPVLDSLSKLRAVTDQSRTIDPYKLKKVLSQLLITVPVCLLFCQPLIAQKDSSVNYLRTDAPSSASGRTSATSLDSNWHFEVSPYLWFAGAHGTVGVLGRNASIHASPGDLLSHLNVGLMGASELRYKRLVLNGNLIWIRLSDSAALPYPRFAATSADVRVGELMWTSKLGYRVIDRKSLKADANVGARYWHLGQRLDFNPTPQNLSFNGSQDWTDIIVGGRVQFPSGDKAVVSLFGDVGGWNASAKLDYAFAGVLGYRIHPKWMLLAGYGYQFIDYRGSNSYVFNVVTSGALFGATYRFK
jgi:hypothetical protein